MEMEMLGLAAQPTDAATGWTKGGRREAGLDRTLIAHQQI